ncbi:nucleotide-diphospho-sugar transferase [Aspergillus pseudodeflectus]|uniref:Nucleotide-diphospho-sugar transferase n=1 Tax=Aspergillus pseudodeflectus TaxID=176178 RepID=A0ABR4L4K5_9EURO
MFGTLAAYRSARTVKAFLGAGCLLIILFGIFLFGPDSWPSPGHWSPSASSPPPPASAPASHDAPDVPQRYAFATILTGEEDHEKPVLEKPYFIAARLLTYQLLHSPDTRSATEIPFLVLVTDDVPEEQRAVLAQDGATVIPVESISRDWVLPKWDRWKGVLAKLNVWKMTTYDKIAFLDADSILFRPVDGIFTDPTTAIRKTKPDPNQTVPTLSALPSTYMIAGIHDSWVEANLPPLDEPGKNFYVKDNYMNAGFFVFAPSEEIFEYYSSLLNTPGAFDPNYPEQNLLNCAHRVDGRMPWVDIGTQWSQKGTGREAYEKGLKSVHQKWWVAMGDEVLDGYVTKVMGEMKGFFNITETAGGS